MTVTVSRPPGRNAGNKILPFRRPIPTGGLIRNPKFPNWKPPVPEPLPPAPLLQPKDLLLIGGAVLAGLAARVAQVWGWLGGRPPTKTTAGLADGANIVGMVPPPGNTIGGTFTVTRVTGSYRQALKADCSTWSGHTASNSNVQNHPNVVAVRWAPFMGECGVRRVEWEVTLTDGRKVLLADLSVTYGLKDVTVTWILGWNGGGAVPFVPDTTALPLPDGWQAPVVEPELEPLPPLITPVLPVPVVPKAPEAEPAPLPTTPGPTRPAVPAVPAAPSFTPIRPPGSASVNNGVLVPPKPAPVPTTPADVVFPVPGGAPVGGPGQSPKPDLVGIAQEVGKIERKLEGLLNPRDPEVNPVPNWLEDLAKLWDVFSSIQGGGKYLLVEPCDPDGDGEFVKREVQYQGALGMLGLLSNKIDALAQLQQAAKDLRQPTCPRPRPQGELVTANFRSMAHSPASRQYLRKQLRYRDNAGRSEAEHVAHWEQFEWQAGPAIVTSAGASWGIVKVWAADPEEGRRVIRHAAAIAGVDLTVKDHRWLDSASSDPRFGKSGQMAVERDMDGTVCVSKRVGPSGQPSWMLKS